MIDVLDSRDVWAQFAICANAGRAFFAPAGERPERRVEREARAKAICQDCPVILACRDAGRTRREHGVWGGETEEERAALGFAPERASRRLVALAKLKAS